MSLKRRMAVLAATVVAAPLVAVFATAGPASAHGWVTNPPSRQDQCAKGVVANCGSVQYEPQSVEAPKGATSCSGGGSFSVLNDDSMPWRVSNIGSNTAFTWHHTAAHRTSNYLYYVDGRLHQSFSGNNTQPPTDLTHNVTGLPSGRHKILAVWNIFDTANAFYSCVDVNVGGGGGGTVTPPTQPPTGTPGGACAAAWSASAVYTGGTSVSYNGQNFRARWWTQGETPSLANSFGVWEAMGAC
jgi:predicted carbohydrate-binding protein with CBM5 and CBM33 domain